MSSKITVWIAVAENTTALRLSPCYHGGINNPCKSVCLQIPKEKAHSEQCARIPVYVLAIASITRCVITINDC